MGAYEASSIEADAVVRARAADLDGPLSIAIPCTVMASQPESCSPCPEVPTRSSLSGADPETLTFLADDRYPTADARVLADQNGLMVPPVADVLKRWADHLDTSTRAG